MGRIMHKKCSTKKSQQLDGIMTPTKENNLKQSSKVIALLLLSEKTGNGHTIIWAL